MLKILRNLSLIFFSLFCVENCWGMEVLEDCSSPSSFTGGCKTLYVVTVDDDIANHKGLLNFLSRQKGDVEIIAYLPKSEGDLEKEKRYSSIVRKKVTATNCLLIYIVMDGSDVDVSDDRKSILVIDDADVTFLPINHTVILTDINMRWENGDAMLKRLLDIGVTLPPCFALTSEESRQTLDRDTLLPTGREATDGFIGGCHKLQNMRAFNEVFRLCAESRPDWGGKNARILESLRFVSMTSRSISVHTSRCSSVFNSGTLTPKLASPPPQPPPVGFGGLPVVPKIGTIVTATLAYTAPDELLAAALTNVAADAGDAHPANVAAAPAAPPAPPPPPPPPQPTCLQKFQTKCGNFVRWVCCLRERVKVI